MNDDKEHSIDEVVSILGVGLNLLDRQKIIKDVRAIKKSLTHLKEIIKIGAQVSDVDAMGRVAEVLANGLIDSATDDVIEIGCCGRLKDKKRK